MKQCLLCENETGIESWLSFFGAKAPPLCPKCLEKLVKINGPSCRLCSRPMEENGICPDCEGWGESAFVSNQSLYLYNEAMQSIIARFKYRGDYVLASIFAEDVRRAVSLAACDIICAVPLPPSRLAERRFNQSEALIEAAGLTHVPLISRSESEKQAKKSRIERVNAAQTFYPIGDADGKSVLVIDDIYTTGATIRLIAEALVEAGASAIKSVTIARSGS
jgi:competence protein ComFC